MQTEGFWAFYMSFFSKLYIEAYFGKGVFIIEKNYSANAYIVPAFLRLWDK